MSDFFHKLEVTSISNAKFETYFIIDLLRGKCLVPGIILFARHLRLNHLFVIQNIFSEVYIKLITVANFVVRKSKWPLNTKHQFNSKLSVLTKCFLFLKVVPVKWCTSMNIQVLWNKITWHSCYVNNLTLRGSWQHNKFIPGFQYLPILVQAKCMQPAIT